MALDLTKHRGIPLDAQEKALRDAIDVRPVHLDEGAFGAARLTLMHAVEGSAVRFGHACARTDERVRAVLGRILVIEQRQQTVLARLAPEPRSLLGAAMRAQQAAIDLTACIAEHEPDARVREVYERAVILHWHHRRQCAELETGGAPPPLAAPRRPYDRVGAYPITKLDARTMHALAEQLHESASALAPLLEDPRAREVVTAIAESAERQLTVYESLVDPRETWLERWVLHEACEVHAYRSCAESEEDPHLRRVWERFAEYELGHLDVAARVFEELERRDVSEVLPSVLPASIDYVAPTAYVREVLRAQSLRRRTTGHHAA